MTDFVDLLSKNVEDVERPKPLPMGNYIFNVVKHDFDKSARKQTPYVRFTATPISPLDDVDQELLPENWNQKTMRVDYYLTDDALFRLKDFLEKLGLSLSGRTFAEVIPETTNCQFIGTVTHETSTKNPEDIFANITDVTAAE